ncbi:MAG: hypothetical protein LBS99_03070, partial [Clostridiales bacterium]|nr:hypothetical protein [Clostridiales bacterium]
MKTKKVLVFLLAIVLAFSFIGCNNKPKFTVTVTNGTGGGEYTQDTDCTVIADAVTGKAFVKWTVDDVSVSTDASYTFKVTEDVTVVAVFEFVDYTISVTGGTADKAAANYGQTVTLTPGAADTGKEFDYFTLNGTKITGDTFAMPAGNATVVAVYKFIAYTISVTGGSADKATGNYGETVTLTPGAPETGKEFDYWTVNDAKITGNTFAMPAANVTVVGTFKTAIYNITVTGGTADKATASYGETVTLTPGAAPAGKEFDYWTVNAGKITGSTFVIAAHSTVAAVYKDIPYNITVTGGTAKSTGVYGETITLTPTVSPFTFWNVNGIQIAGNTFVMPAKDTVVTANKLTTPYSDSGDGNSEKDKILVRFSDPYL